MSISKIFIIFICLFACLSCTKEEMFFESPADTNLVQPLLLNLDEQPCFLDVESNMLKYCIGKDKLQNFSPIIDFQDHSRLLFNGEELENHAKNDLGNVKINTPYVVTITANDQVNEFTLYFTTLPLVQIVTLNKIIQQPKVFGRLNIINPKENEPFYSSLIGIETRGASSGSFDKKSFGFKMLNSFNMDDTCSVSFFDMKSQNKWILDGMFVDRARCRNKTGFEIWGSLNGESDHIAIKSEYVELYHNYTYLGIYCFNENVTDQFLSLSDESVLIVGKDNTKATKFYKYPEHCSQTTYWNMWQQKYPDPDETLRWDTFEELSRVVVEGSDEEFKNNIFNLIEEENLIDYLLFVNLMNGYDNLGKNWFFMQRSRDDQFLIIPWDLDATWGRNHVSEQTSHDKFQQNGLFKRLKEVNPDNFNKKTKDRWLYLRQNQFSEAILFDQFSSNFNILETSKIILLENDLWEEDLNLVEEEAYIREWITKRLAYLDAYFGTINNPICHMGEDHNKTKPTKSDMEMKETEYLKAMRKRQ